MIKMTSEHCGKSFSAEIVIGGGESEIVKLPAVPEVRGGIEDIGYLAEDGVEVYVTISREPVTDMWQQADDACINSAVTYFKFVNTHEAEKKAMVRAVAR